MRPQFQHYYRLNSIKFYARARGRYIKFNFLSFYVFSKVQKTQTPKRSGESSTQEKHVPIRTIIKVWSNFNFFWIVPIKVRFFRFVLSRLNSRWKLAQLVMRWMWWWRGCVLVSTSQVEVGTSCLILFFYLQSTKHILGYISTEMI